MTITIEAPELEACLTKAAAESNTRVGQYAAQILQRTLTSDGDAESDNPLRSSVSHDDPSLEPVTLDDWKVLNEQPLSQREHALYAYGKFAHVLTSSDEFAARKEEEKARE